MPKKWSEDEVAKLSEYYPTTPLSQLLNVFPDRTGDSIDKKAYKLGLKKASAYNASKGEILTDEEQVLQILITEDLPIEIETLVERTGLTSRKIRLAMKSLMEDGYDITEIVGGSDRLYGLVRTGVYDPENFYRFQGEIETPVLMTGDWHLGNRLHSRQAFEHMLESIEEYSPATVMIDGDLLQGFGVHTRELIDISIKTIDEQVEEGVEYLKEIPNCVKTIGITMGNHESKIKGKWKVGFDACKAVAKEVPRAKYFGFVGKVLLDGDWDYTMMHTEGGVGYAVTYKGQRIRDNLIQRPHILHLAHIHQPYNHPRPHVSGGASTITAGTLKREGGWELQKGWTSLIQYYIMKSWSPTKVSMESFTPRVF